MNSSTRHRIEGVVVDQLMLEQGLDGYAARALVRLVDHHPEHDSAREVALAGLRGLRRHHGTDAAQLAAESAAARASRALTAFAAGMAATYAEMDDEFRQQPNVHELDAYLDRWYS